MSKRAVRDANKIYPPYFWTEDKVKELRRLTSDKRTASEVGQLLGCTKNMVIGKCYRDDIILPNHKVVRSAPPTPDPFPERGCCVWGVGDPREPGFHFCSERNAPGNRNYCNEHASRVRSLAHSSIKVYNNG
jgi:GcrA cell cycle regulator